MCYFVVSHCQIMLMHTVYACLVVALPSMAMYFPGLAVYTAVIGGLSLLDHGPNPFPLYPAVETFTYHP